MNERIAYISSIIVLLLALAVSVRTCSSNDSDLAIAEQNLKALTDTTRETRNRLNQVQFERNTFMGDIETLRKLNSDLVNELEAQKGNVRVVTRVVTEVVFDTIYVDNRVNRINDSMFVIGFSYLKDYDSLNSVSFKGTLPATVMAKEKGFDLRSSSTSIQDMSIRMKIYTGIREEQGTYSIFARTDFPGVKFDLSGAIVDPEKSFVDKKNGPFSILLGAGMGYGYTTSGTGFFPSVGLYVGLNLLNF